MSTTTPDLQQYLQSLPEKVPAEKVIETCNPVLAHLVDQPPLTQDQVIKQLAARTGAGIASLRTQLKWMIQQHERDQQECGEPDDKEPEWMKQLVRAPNGAIKGNIANVMLFLANEWAGCIGYDEFRHEPVWLDAPKWDETERDNKQVFQVGQDLEDGDAGRLQAWLGRRGCDVNYDTAFRALDLAAQNNSFHPIRDYLDLLEWDGKPRVKSFYAQYFGTADNDYTQLVSRIQLVSSVARIYQPGCKVDTMTILEGEQGLKGSADQESNGMLGKGKSSSFKQLYGAKHFTDHLSELGSKDAFQELQGIWCAEMAELDSLSRVDANLAKKFISSSVDKFRPSYGRRVKSYPRQGILVGSINPDGDLGYLKDQTGARRYLPITVTRCDVGGIANDRDQIWAETVYMYKSGVKWWAVKDEEEILEAEQDKRRQSDPWEDIVAKFVERFTHPTITSTYLLQNAIGLTPDRMAGYNMSRMGSVMKRLGWQHDRVERKNITCKFYRRPGSAYFEVKPDYSLDPDGPPSAEQLQNEQEEMERLMNDTGVPAAPAQQTSTEVRDMILKAQGDGTMTLYHPDWEEPFVYPVPSHLEGIERLRATITTHEDGIEIDNVRAASLQ